MTPFLLSLLLAFTPGVPDGGVVVAKGQKFLAEVALTPREQARGLMYRTNLAKDRCMIFIYKESSFHSIWMRNCLISLDVVWVKEDGTIVELEGHVPPASPMLADDQCPTYGGKVESNHFIEFPVGTIHRLGLKKGDRIGWNVTFSSGGSSVGGVPVPADKPKHHK